MRLSSRERVLIVMLLFICIVLGGYKFLIEPKMKELKANKEEFANAQQLEVQMRATLGWGDTTKIKIEELKQEAQNDANLFFDEMSAAQVHDWISQTGSENGLTLVNLFIDEKSTYEFGKTDGEKTEALTYPIYEYAQQFNNGQDITQTPAEQTEHSTIICYKAQAEFRGTYEQIWNYIDAVCKYNKACKMSNMTLNQLDGEVTVNMDIMLFSVEKLD